jgi:isopentenyl-diphosphate Delta-isomerase
MEHVILVDEADNELGTMEKMEAHRVGALHRALSVFIYNAAGEMLLQRRNPEKYHSGGLWTNTCCSHPRPGEDVKTAAARRLLEEMGIETELREIFSFTYKAPFENGLTEHEFDHVFIGFSNDLPIPNPDEVVEYRYVDQSTLTADIESHPHKYTEWFKLCRSKVDEFLNATAS